VYAASHLDCTLALVRWQPEVRTLPASDYPWGFPPEGVPSDLDEALFLRTWGKEREADGILKRSG
jgi:hypothetical protein